MSDFNDFRNKTIKEIRIWAWLAAVLPLMALAGVFFIWTFGTDTLFARAMIFGEVSMFTIAVIWWWWAIYVINKLVRQWDATRAKVSDLLVEVKDINKTFKDSITS